MYVTICHWVLLKCNKNEILFLHLGFNVVTNVPEHQKLYMKMRHIKCTNPSLPSVHVYPAINGQLMCHNWPNNAGRSTLLWVGGIACIIYSNMEMRQLVDCIFALTVYHLRTTKIARTQNPKHGLKFLKQSFCFILIHNIAKIIVSVLKKAA
jgi:hypothetical protein